MPSAWQPCQTPLGGAWPPGNASPGHNACPRGNNARPMNKKLLQAQPAGPASTGPGRRTGQPWQNQVPSIWQLTREYNQKLPLELSSEDRFFWPAFEVFLLEAGLRFDLCWCAELPDDDDDGALFILFSFPF